MTFVDETKDKINEEANEAKDAINHAFDKVGDRLGDAKENIRERWNNLTDFNVNVSGFNKVMDKIGLRDNLPADMRTRLDDGSLTDEEVRSYFNNNKDEIRRKVDESPDSDEIKNILLMDEEPRN